MHIFAFNPTLYTSKKYVDGSIAYERRLVNGREINYFKSPKTVAYARQHFNCNTINEIHFEN